jgi:hypothetical protein
MLVRFILISIAITFCAIEGIAQKNIKNISVLYRVTELPEIVPNGDLARVVFKLHHIPDSTAVISEVMNVLVMINGAQPSIFYQEKEIKFVVEPTDKLEILIRPFWHYYFQVDNLKIEVDKDYEIDIWFRLFEDIMIEPDSLRYVKPLRIYTNYNDHEG